jgi:hypothetical protein
MNRPGERLRAFAERWCGAETMTRIVDPLIADLQHEHAQAVLEGRIWRSRAIQIAGWIACLKVLGICTWRDGLAPRHWTADDRRASLRTAAYSVVLVVAVMALLELKPMLDLKWRWHGSTVMRDRLFLTLIPSALAIAITIGLTLGIVCGIGGRALSRRVGGAVVLLALLASALSFANLGWILPAANQAFRVTFTGRLDPAKGAPELTLGELRQAIEKGEREAIPAPPPGFARNLNVLKLQYHDRWALSLSPIVFAVLILSIAAAGHLPRRVLGAAAVAACLGFYVMLYAGRLSVLAGTVPAYISAWAPNMTFALVTAVLALRKHRASVRDEPAR